MSDDFNAAAGAKHMNVLIAARQRAVANLAAYGVENDVDSAASEIGAISELDKQIQNLAELAAREQARLTPRQPPPVSREVREARKPHEMDDYDKAKICGISVEEYRRGRHEMASELAARHKYERETQGR
jgi:hypothetical protein